MSFCRSQWSTLLLQKGRPHRKPVFYGRARKSCHLKAAHFRYAIQQCSMAAKKGVLSRTQTGAKLPLHLSYYVLLAFRLLADVHPALGSGDGDSIVPFHTMSIGLFLSKRDWFCHPLRLPVQDSLIFRSANRFTASGSENFASFRRLPRISTL